MRAITTNLDRKWQGDVFIQKVLAAKSTGYGNLPKRKSGRQDKYSSLP